MSEGRGGRTEIVCFEVVVKTSKEHSRTFCGTEFHVVGAEIRKAREPSERLWRRTVSSLAEEEHMVRGGLLLMSRLARYGGQPEPSALNVIVESLKVIWESVVSQFECRSSAVVDFKGNEVFCDRVILARAFCSRWSHERYFSGQPNRIELA